MEIGEELGALLTDARSTRWASQGLRRSAMVKPPQSGRTVSSSMLQRCCTRSWEPQYARVLGKGAALIPSSKKRGGIGVTLDIPLGHKDAAYVRSHFDGMEIRVSDAPRANEILVAIAVTDSGRPLARVGGLTKDQFKGEDGLR